MRTECKEGLEFGARRGCAPAYIERRRRWLRFIVGLAMLALAVCFFASGYSPPGICGEVLRHNQVEDIDASPLFYTEVEHMPELEEGVRTMREKAKSVRGTR